MTPDERKRAKNESRTETEESKTLRRELHYGMNSFMHGMERNDVSSALLSEDLQPKFLLNILVQLAAIHQIPVIILPGLRDLTKNTIGFSSSSLAVKKMTAENENSHFYPLHKIIVDLSREYNIPKNATLSHIPLEESNSALDLSVSDLQQQDECKSSGKSFQSNLSVPYSRSSKQHVWKYSTSSEKQAQFLNKKKCKKISMMPNDQKPVLLEEVTTDDDSSVDMEISDKLPQMELKETQQRRCIVETSLTDRHPYLRIFQKCSSKVRKHRITKKISVNQETVSENCDEKMEID